MLAAAKAALVQHGLLRAGEELPPFFGKLSGNLVFATLMYLPDGSFYQVKVAMLGELEREYRGQALAYAAMPRNVARPIGLTRQGSYPVLVSAGVTHTPLAVLRGELQRYESAFAEFFALAARTFVAREGDTALDWNEALEHASKSARWPHWQAYREQIAAGVAALPRIPQHGDFTLNNIGVTGTQLVFFDWEDFGHVDLPGFDLAVFLLSLYEFDLARLVDKLQRDSVERRLMEAACPSLTLTPDFFLRLFPAYLALFAHMKAILGYAPEVSARAVAALNYWVAKQPSPTEVQC